MAEGLAKVDQLAPGSGWATLGATWAAGAGWKATAELGERTGWGELYAQGWYTGSAGGVAAGVRW